MIDILAVIDVAVDSMVKAGASAEAVRDMIAKIKEQVGHCPVMSHGTNGTRKEKERIRKKLYRDKQRDMSHGTNGTIPSFPDGSPHTPFLKPILLPPKPPLKGGQKVPKKPTPRISLEELSVDHIAKWLIEKRGQGKYLHHDEHFILETFKDYCRATGRKYTDYPAAYRNAFEWERFQPGRGFGGTPGPGRIQAGRDDRDPASRAHDEANAIIARRNAEWDEREAREARMGREAAEGQPGGAEQPDPFA